MARMDLTTFQLDARFGYRLRMGGARTLDLFLECFNLTDRSNFTNPSGDRRTLATPARNGLVAGGFPRQLQIGTRLGFCTQDGSFARPNWI
jgi:hypothetical protein